MRADACKPPGTCVDPTLHMARLQTCRILLSRGCSALCSLCTLWQAVMGMHKSAQLVSALKMVANGMGWQQAFLTYGWGTSQSTTAYRIIIRHRVVVAV